MGIAMDNSDPAKLDGLLDAEVEISGVASGRFDGKMQETGVLIHTPDFNYVRFSPGRLWMRGTPLLSGWMRF